MNTVNFYVAEELENEKIGNSFRKLFALENVLILIWNAHGKKKFTINESLSE